MIIGVSGLAGSGKDTIANFLVKHGFQAISLADPLKRICKEVYDFTDDQLWGPSPLRNTSDPRYIRSGKEQHSLITRGSETHVWCTHCEEEFEKEDQRRIRESPCVVYLTPRYALQLLGTEWGRTCYPNTWVDLAIRTARELLRGEGVVLGYIPSQGLFYNSGINPDEKPMERAKGVVIPDVRFRNEFEAIRAGGGYIVRVVRPGAGLKHAYGAHASEVEQTKIEDSEFDALIKNDGTLADLEGKVEQFLALFQRQKG